MGLILDTVSHMDLSVACHHRTEPLLHPGRGVVLLRHSNLYDRPTLPPAEQAHLWSHLPQARQALT